MAGLFSKWRHLTYKIAVFTNDGYGEQPENRVVSALADSNVISSEITEGLHTGHHTLMIDLDVPAVLIPSSTPGHSHLYIDVPMAWEDYKRLLSALSRAGIVETGYVEASIDRKHTSLRLPWVRKEPAIVPVEPVEPF